MHDGVVFRRVSITCFKLPSNLYGAFVLLQLCFYRVRARNVASKLCQGIPIASWAIQSCF